MKFLDQAKIFIRSGNGGAGSVSFRREKYVEYGGPNGGDGGKGGDVWVESVENLNTLIDYRYQQHFKAKTGSHGEGSNRSGRAGDDITLKVPVGTQILDEDNEEVLVDLDKPGMRILLMEGGRGGKGNAHFKSSTNQAPRHAQPGEAGQERWIWLRLKLIADAGLIGLPNAGKSTFLASATSASPKIAAYPFTTLHPNLGVVDLAADARFVLADIPGLIEGAHEGAGIGDRFLGHIERTAVLLHLVDAGQEDVAAGYRIVRGELEAYGADLTAKSEIVVLSKTDTVDEETLEASAKSLEAECGSKPLRLSAATNTGVREALFAVWKEIRTHRGEIATDEDDAPVEDGGDWTP